MIPKKDSDLQTIAEITERMLSIQKQISAMDDLRPAPSAVAYEKRNTKYARLVSRYDALHTARANLLRQGAQ